MRTFTDIAELHRACRTPMMPRWPEFHVIRNEDTSGLLVDSMPPHRCDFYQVCLDLESDYDIGVDNLRERVSNNALYFIPRGAILSWASEHADRWRGYTVFFRADFLSDDPLGGVDRLLGGVEPALVQLDEAATQQLSYLCERMLEEQEGDLPDTLSILRDWLRIFLQYANRSLQFGTTDHAGAEMQLKYKFQELLSVNVHRQRKVSFYASALNLSARHFTRQIKLATGMSPKQHIQDKLIDVAKAQLFDGQLTISEVAYALGYTNAPQFTKAFKRGTGMTPSAFQRMAVDGRLISGGS